MLDYRPRYSHFYPQLRCSEPGCPPIETVIAVMFTPIRQVKIHKVIAEIEREDISQSVLG